MAAPLLGYLFAMSSVHGQIFQTAYLAPAQAEALEAHTCDGIAARLSHR
jgi:hypothetical protein